MKKKNTPLLRRLRKNKVKVYKKTKDFKFPNGVRLHSYVLLGKLEYFVSVNETIVPCDRKGDGIITWEALVQHNPRLAQIQEEIHVYQQEIFSTQEWDNAAQIFINELRMHFFVKNSVEAVAVAS